MTRPVLSLGGFSLDPDSSWFRITRQGIRGNTGRLTKIRHIWDINGRVNGTTTSAVDSACNSLIGAVKEDIDIVFSLGGDMKLLTSNTTEGTHVAKFEWLPGCDGVRGSGAEGVLRRTFHLVIFGDILQNSDTNLTAWHDSLKFVGTGGSHTVPVGSLSGTVQAQTLKQYTPTWIIQTGYATGLTSYPIAPVPTFNGMAGVYRTEDGITTEQESAKEIGKYRSSGYTTRWRYKSWTSTAITGSPIPFS